MKSLFSRIVYLLFLCALSQITETLKKIERKFLSKINLLDVQHSINFTYNLSDFHLSPMRDVGLVAAFSVMVLMDLIGNTMVILVILLNKSMKTPMNRLLLNLAVADVAVAIFTALQFVLGPFYQHPTGSTGALLCKFITGGPMIWTAALVSICNLVAISYER